MGMVRGGGATGSETRAERGLKDELRRGAEGRRTVLKGGNRETASDGEGGTGWRMVRGGECDLRSRDPRERRIEG